MIFFSNPQNATSLNKAVKKGKLRLLTKGVYIDVKDNSEEQIRTKIVDIVSHLKVSGIVSYSSALYPDYFDNNKIMWISGSDSRTIVLDDMKIMVMKSNDKDLNAYATVNLEKTLLKTPNFYRAILQNFSTRKVDNKRIDKVRALNLLIEESFKLNDNYFNILLNNLSMHAKSLDYQNEYKIIEVVLNDYKKKNNLALLDNKRVKMFNTLLEKLDTIDIHELDDINLENPLYASNLAFFESYFSNYIEGTEFEVDEAYSIIFNPKNHYARAKDGHDIKKSYELMLDNISNPVEIKTDFDYIKTLKQWHHMLLDHRSDDINVGDFKVKKNKAGSVYFVEPHKVEEMLKYSFNLSKTITNPLKKALFLKITFTEIHPFEDGNGRMSRIILNNFLSLYGKKRVIIPNVFREDYILSLKGFSSENNTMAILKTMNKAFLITNNIPYQLEINKLIGFLKDNSAFSNPNESVWGVNEPTVKDHSEQLDLFSQISPIKRKM